MYGTESDLYYHGNGIGWMFMSSLVLHAEWKYMNDRASNIAVVVRKNRWTHAPYHGDIGYFLCEQGGTVLRQVGEEKCPS